MIHQNTQTLGEALREFFEGNSELRGKILEIRVQRGWRELFGPMVAQYTRELYVFLTSSVLRNELVMCRERMMKRLNEYAGSEVIKDIMIR